MAKERIYNLTSIEDVLTFAAEINEESYYIDWDGECWTGKELKEAIFNTSVDHDTWFGAMREIEPCEMETIRKRLNLRDEWSINMSYSKGKRVFYTFRQRQGAETRIISSASMFRFLKERESARKEIEEAMLRQKGYTDYEYFDFVSDAGSLSIGNENFHINIPNGWGDGDFYIRIYERNIDLESFKRGWQFHTTIAGTFYLFSFDCLKSKGREREIENNEAMKLSGRYAIYTRPLHSGRGCGIALVKWGDNE